MYGKNSVEKMNPSYVPNRFRMEII